MKTEYELMVIAFENGAKKKGYSFEKDDEGRYIDNWLQEAWEIFGLIDLTTIKQWQLTAADNNGTFHDEITRKVMVKISRWLSLLDGARSSAV